jgi:tripartite-type tricarboxylate transporter receptor subunit TctC
MQRTYKFLGAMALAATTLCASSAHAHGETYPTRPIQMIVPQAPGGTNDIVARLVAADLSVRLGQAIVVDNRPGAGGNIGTQAAARATPDGYTLLMTISSTQDINPSLYKKIPFDPVADFEPIAAVASVPNVLVVNPAFPVKTLAELIAVAKDKPNFYRFASAGNGTLNHLLGEMLNSMAGISMQHVPYKGVAPALNDVLGGQLPIVFASLPSALSHIKAGKLRALAVSGDKRSPVLPYVPAIAEAVPGYNGTLWIGLFAPAGVPPEVLSTLQDATRKALAAKDLRDKLEQQGVEIAPPTMPDQFSKLLQDDLAKWARIVKASGAAID